MVTSMLRSMMHSAQSWACFSEAVESDSDYLLHAGQDSWLVASSLQKPAVSPNPGGAEHEKVQDLAEVYQNPN